MGELAVTDRDDDALCAIGLGSCIGLVLLDTGRARAGLAHVVLPDSAAHRGAPDGPPPGKFADVAVPALVDAIVAIGARRSRLGAVLVGGAAMFALRPGRPGQDVGRRNAEAVRQALKDLAIPVLAADTGGSTGRTLRVRSTGTVVVRLAGAGDRVLLDPERDGARSPTTRSTAVLRAARITTMRQAVTA
ncbi:MAG: chemotaxis protein CheD [Solirubrobacteraceae bacterium]